ncbi:MAG: NAD+ synthase, partial [Opitutales bacterium]|nr:NAD+ synthase [Opitutales bacterium]
MKIGLAQINTTVGDLLGNEALIIDAYRTLIAQGAQYVVFPELVVTGYPPRDLLFKRSFALDNVTAAQRIATQSNEVPMIFGFVEPNAKDFGRQFFNSAAVCYNGK